MLARSARSRRSGFVDITLEALVDGLLIGARVVVVVLAFALLVATVDPDAVLRGLRRVSFRSALTAVLATRMVPVLTRDARRMDLALRSRPDVDRARDRRARRRGARGDGRRARPRRRRRRDARAARLRDAPSRRPPARAVPWSRHDASRARRGARAVGALALWTAIAGVAAVEPYPRLTITTTAGHARPRRRRRRRRAAAVRQPPGGGRAVSTLRVERLTYTYPGAARPRCATSR